jgi:hypothetical protein
VPSTPRLPREAPQERGLRRLLALALAPAQPSDGALTARLLPGKADPAVLGATGHRSGPVHARLAMAHDLALLAPRRRDPPGHRPSGRTNSARNCPIAVVGWPRAGSSSCPLRRRTIMITSALRNSRSG